METDTRFERAPQEVAERLARLEEHRQHVATKEDITELKRVIDLNNAELRRFIERTVSKSEIVTLKGFLRNWTVGAGIFVPLMTAVIVVLLNTLLNN